MINNIVVWSGRMPITADGQPASRDFDRLLQEMVKRMGGAAAMTNTELAVWVAFTTLAEYGITDAAPLTHVGAGGTAHADAVAAGAAGFMTGAQVTKLNGIATGATANSPDATLLARANHTGTQAKATVGLGSVDDTADTAKPVSTAQQTALNLKANLASPTFTGTVGGITKAMVGLTNANDTADTAKPVSTAQATAIALKQDSSAKNAASGYAGLSASSRITKGADTTDDLVIDLASKGLVLKDTQGTPHYWRVTISTTGVLTTADLGTSKP